MRSEHTKLRFGDNCARSMEQEGGRMKEQTFCEIVEMILRSCNSNFYKGTDYDGMKIEIIRCATKIYIEQMKQIGVYAND